MMQKLTTKEIARRNQLIDQCETLIRARGASSNEAGIYQTDEFCVRFSRRGRSARLQVAYFDASVMEVHWEQAGDPGRGFLAPGPWQTDFLSIQAMHS